MIIAEAPIEVCLIIHRRHLLKLVFVSDLLVLSTEMICKPPYSDPKEKTFPFAPGTTSTNVLFRGTYLEKFLHGE